MALIRGHHTFDDHFAQIPNQWLRDSRLSLEARGLLAQIMSHRPGWNLSIQSIGFQNNIGRDKVRRILGELFECGYLERSEKQTHDEQGRLAGFDYITRDPQGVAQEPTKAEPTKAEPTEVAGPPKNTISKNTITEEKPSNRTRPTNADEYEPSKEFLEKLAIDFPGVRLDSQLEKFRDHHMAAGSTFKIWDRAFRKWVRQASEWSPEARAARVQAEEEAKWKKLMEERGME